MCWRTLVISASPRLSSAAARCQAREGFVPADAAAVANRKCRRVDVIDGGSLSQAAEQKARQRGQRALLERYKTLITRHRWTIAAQHLACAPIIKTFPIFEPHAMQHQKIIMISLTDRPGSGPRRAVPLRIKYAAHCGKHAWQKSSTAQKVSTSRSNILTSYGIVGSAHFLESLIHNVLMPPMPDSGVN